MAHYRTKVTVRTCRSIVPGSIRWRRRVCQISLEIEYGYIVCLICLYTFM